MQPIARKASGAKTTLPEIGPDTMIYEGKAVSLLSPLGALTVLHGALQSSIGTVDEALTAEAAYRKAVGDLTPAT